MADDSTTLKLRITGRVQGVGYRAWASRTARDLALSGWVRNLNDGTVEALVRGPKATVDAFVGACQAGPPLARVISVDSKPETMGDLPPGFHQAPTADP